MTNTTNIFNWIKALALSATAGLILASCDDNTTTDDGGDGGGGGGGGTDKALEFTATGDLSGDFSSTSMSASSVGDLLLGVSFFNNNVGDNFTITFSKDKAAGTYNINELDPTEGLSLKLNSIVYSTISYNPEDTGELVISAFDGDETANGTFNNIDLVGFDYATDPDRLDTLRIKLTNGTFSIK